MEKWIPIYMIIKHGSTALFTYREEDAVDIAKKNKSSYKRIGEAPWIGWKDLRN